MRWQDIIAKRRKEREAAQELERQDQRRLEIEKQRRQRQEEQRRQVADIMLKRQLSERARQKSAQEEEFRQRMAEED